MSYLQKLLAAGRQYGKMHGSERDEFQRAVYVLGGAIDQKQRKIERLTAENTDWQILCEELVGLAHEHVPLPDDIQAEFNRLAHKAVTVSTLHAPKLSDFPDVKEDPDDNPPEMEF